LIDCGEGTQLLLKKNKVRLSSIDYIFISHLHGDHYFGLIGLLSTMHLFGRQKEMVIVGPPGLRDILSLQFKYSDTSLGYNIDFREFTPEEKSLVFENEKIQVTTIPMNHRVPCSGYLFTEKEKKRRINHLALQETKLNRLDIARLKNGEDILNDDGTIKYANLDFTLDPLPQLSYAYCADSKYKPSLTAQLNGVDLMYHEATFANDMTERAGQTFHTTAHQAATLAKDAKVGKLLLGHFSARYKELDPIINEAKAVFENTELAIEGKKFSI